MANTPTTPTATPTPKTSLDVMLDTFNEGLAVIQKIMPDIQEVGGLVPGASVYIQFASLLIPAAQNAIKFIEKEEGKTPLQAFEDILKTLTPNNGFVSPSLSKTP